MQGHPRDIPSACWSARQPNAAGLLPPVPQKHFGGMSTNYATALAKASKIAAQAQADLAGKLDINTAADSAGDEVQATAAKRRKGEEAR